MPQTRYVATGIVEPNTFLADLDGEKLHEHYLVVITQADTDEPETDSQSLFASEMVVAVLDTLTCLCRPIPDWDQFLAGHGWKRPGNATWEKSGGCFHTEVVADDPAQVPPPVEYEAGEPLPLYVKAAEARAAGTCTEYIIDAVAWAAAESANLDRYALTWTELYHRIEDSAHDAAAIAAGSLNTTVGTATGRDAQLIVSAAIDATYELLAAEPASCRTCDGIAVSVSQGQPVCRNTGH
ncbi:hypothetical protein [Nonomuraea endophytica]|uniref:Uncharacterized protein n=1 Tax=Nonomuraea endophytica TaxID=714136 RepID=A0A7W8EJ54_9ACTN|nr:hypothetical protein [Nonomuraea endophytica]MBB5081279.1 hypothetical protein [Nonomuraea endophytica]